MAAFTAYQEIENEQVQFVNDRNFNKNRNYSTNNYHLGL